MVLDVRNLKTYFYTAAGIVQAVEGMTYTVRPGETIVLVGESGCGKSVSALSVMRLVSAPAGRIDGAASDPSKDAGDLPGSLQRAQSTHDGGANHRRAAQGIRSRP